MDYKDFFVGQNLPEPLSKKELMYYFKQYKDGNLEAKNIIINHNIKLVLNQVIKIFYNIDYDKEDLVSIGIIGLIKAVETFDIKKNNAFSTFAAVCINNEIYNYIRKLKRTPNTLSLETLIIKDTDCSDMKLQDILFDEKITFVEDYEKACVLSEIKKQVESLNERDKKIIKLYFGFDNNIQHTQKEIADIFGCSRMNISLIIIRVLKSIKRNLENKDFIEKQQRKKIVAYNKK